MIEAAAIVLRLLQYGAGSVLMGSALFVLYALPREDAPTRWTKPCLASAAVVLTVSALAGYVTQTALLAGSWQAALTAESLGAMFGTSLGKAALVRSLVAALAALVLIAARPGRSLWIAAAALGTVGVATFAWMGHGAASENALQLVADLIHVLTAAAWIGALVGFVLIAKSATEPSRVAVLHQALRSFSTIGVALVAALVLSGLVNSWFLVGIDHAADLLTTAYGRLLSLKLVLFAGMLVLAARNRTRHTPAIERNDDSAAALRAVRRSTALELSLGFGILAAVAWLGTLAPPAG